MTVRVAILGLGTWGRTLVAAVNGKCEPSDLIHFTHACVRDPTKHRASLTKYGLEPCSFEDALADKSIDGVAVATPHGQHYSQSRLALLAGKHVFCEKPAALTASETEELFDIAGRNDLTFAVGFNRRFLPAVARLSQMIESGELGTIINIEGNFSGAFGLNYEQDVWRASDDNAPAGGLTAMGIHVIDLFIHLLGEIDSADANAFRNVEGMHIDDTVNVSVRFKSGISGYLTTMMATPWIWRLQVFGTKAWVHMRSDTTLEMQRVVKADERYVEREPELLTFERGNPEREELEAFARAIQEAADFPVRPHEVINGAFVMESAIKGTREQ